MALFNFELGFISVFFDYGCKFLRANGDGAGEEFRDILAAHELTMV